ncbi:MAG TPA: 3-phosphoshikimate 1-carboxyvinyltransferase, partial [Pirellulales bacterium]|nr:3-phosphoshikimate 1-carboxyvinyltransferase [Pirellulales bacterium]
SDDTHVMIEALGRLGVEVHMENSGRRLRVRGCGGDIPKNEAELFVGNSGTTVRFLAAMLALGRGRYRLSGTPRMHERPIADLIEALGQLGVDIHSEADNGCPPVVITADGLKGGRAQVRGDVSSQFLSGLLMACPYAQQPTTLEVVGPLVSQPYVRMTLAVMWAFGVDVPANDLTRFDIPRIGYRPMEYVIEPDASAASYFFGAAAVTGGAITVEGLTRSSVQGDVAFVDVLGRMGCRIVEARNGITVHGGPLRGIEVDMNAISDTVQTLGAVALFAEGPTTITGVGHIRHKETDRIGALACELRKLGAQVDELPDGLRIVPGPLHGAAIDTYDDHRMAMSLALVGLRVPGVVIRDPGCTRKTYPGFFDDMTTLVAES